MRAPVYRSLQSSTTLLGLVFPSEFLVMLAVLILTTRLASFKVQLGLMALAYGLIVLAGLGKPPLYKQHLLALYLRRLVWGGRFSAAARATPASHVRFPFASYASRDVPPWCPK